MNCRTSTIGMTTAVALLPERGSAENEMLRKAEVMTPKRNTQTKVSHFPASSGRATPSIECATRMRSAAWTIPGGSPPGWSTIPSRDFQPRSIGEVPHRQ